MSETIPTPAPGTPAIPQEAAQEIRRLIHDLNNALEIIVQTNYLLGTVDLGENGAQWAGMLDSGVKQAIAINQQLRDFVRNHT